MPEEKFDYQISNIRLSEKGHESDHLADTTSLNKTSKYVHILANEDNPVICKAIRINNKVIGYYNTDIITNPTITYSGDIIITDGVTLSTVNNISITIIDNSIKIEGDIAKGFYPASEEEMDDVYEQLAMGGYGNPSTGTYYDIYYHGDWDAGTTYYLGISLVKYGGATIYIAWGSNFSDPPGTGDWLDIGALWQGEWMAGTYNANDVVSHLGRVWVAAADTSEEPPHADWVEVPSRIIDFEPLNYWTSTEEDATQAKQINMTPFDGNITIENKSTSNRVFPIRIFTSESDIYNLRDIGPYGFIFKKEEINGVFHYWECIDIHSTSNWEDSLIEISNITSHLDPGTYHEVEFKIGRFTTIGHFKIESELPVELSYCSIEYRYNEGTSTISIPFGAKITNKYLPEGDIDGIYTDEYHTEEFDLETRIKEDIILYIQWE